MSAATPSVRSLTAGTRVLMLGGGVLGGDGPAAGTLLILPPMLLVFFLNRYILEGFSMGGFDR